MRDTEFVKYSGMPIIGLCYHNIPPRDENIPQRCYHTLRIIFVQQGRGVWSIGNKNYPIMPGDIFILNNDEPRAVRTIYPPENLVLTVIDFEPRFIWSNHQDLFDSSYLRIFFDRKKQNFENRIPNDVVVSFQIQKIIQEMEEEMSAKLPEYQQMLKVKLLNILVIINRYYTNAAGTEDGSSMPLLHYSRISKVLKYIDEHLEEDLSREQLAKYIHMNPSSLSKLFKKYNGIGLAQYIIRKKIHYAIHLLEESSLSVLEIAARCGFNNSANFYKAFKNVTGTIPSSYRKSKERI